MKSETACALLVLLNTVSAFGHSGPRVWVDVVDGKVITLTSNNDLAPVTYTPSRIFGTELTNLFDVYTVNFPGYEVRRTGGHASFGTSFGFNIAGPLLVFNPTTGGYITAQKLLGPPPAGPVVQMAVSLSSTQRFTSTAPVSGFNFFNYTQPGDHSHLTYTMAADGQAYNGPAGVYALPLNLFASGITTSDPYFLLLGKDVAQTSAAFNTALAASPALTAIPADTNFDGLVNAVDLAALASHWQATANWTTGDFNFDGISDISDLYILATHWDGHHSDLSSALASLSLPNVSVPEPATILYTGVVLAIGLSRRR